jgi:hypothetical protein
MNIFIFFIVVMWTKSYLVVQWETTFFCFCYVPYYLFCLVPWPVSKSNMGQQKLSSPIPWFLSVHLKSIFVTPQNKMYPYTKKNKIEMLYYHSNTYYSNIHRKIGQKKILIEKLSERKEHEEIETIYFILFSLFLLALSPFLC